MRIDFANAAGYVETGAGWARFSLPAAILPLPQDFDYADIDLARDELVFGLPSGRRVAVELGALPCGSQTSLNGRAAVYLDQNHWSTLAAWQHGHRPVQSGEATAAERLVMMVEAHEIVLPVSVGNLVETGALFGDRRANHAATLLEHSRGWQMRNPIAIRTDELRSALAGDPRPATEVFTLSADGPFAEALRRPDFSRLPEPMAAAFARIVNVSSIYGAMLQRDAIPDEGGEAAATGWAKSFADVAQRLADDNVSRETARKVSNANVLLDLHPELLGLRSMTELEQWIPRAYDDISALPYLARYRAVLYARLRNAGGPWTSNDLTDLNFLCAAAGYADVVLGERRTIGDLRTATGIPLGARLATSLTEAVELLQNQDADTAR